MTVEPPTAHTSGTTTRKRERERDVTDGDDDTVPSGSSARADTDVDADAEEDDKKSTAPKRRKMWVHALEKSLFTPEELATLGAPVRRTMYTRSLEANIDALHTQLLNIGLFPVPFHKLDPYHGLNTKTAKVMSFVGEKFRF